MGNTLCKSGSIAVFGNVVYSGLLNDHLWHLGVPLFTRLLYSAYRMQQSSAVDARQGNPTTC
ncbi:hypothetical protein PAMP_008720 [Pampus punctatissimus]